MTQRTFGALIVSAGAALLLLTMTASSAGSNATNAFASTRPITRPLAPHVFRHHQRFGTGAFTYWPGYGDDFGAPPTGAPPFDLTPPVSPEITYTYKNDVPWDWAHRFPPDVTPSDHPYVPSCTEQTVTVPGHNGATQTVNVTRCY